MADQGVGIPEDELDAVFDEIAQSRKTRTGAGATGLGLGNSGQIVDGHGGRICAGVRDGGAVVRFELPVKEVCEEPIHFK